MPHYNLLKKKYQSTIRSLYTTRVANTLKLKQIAANNGDKRIKLIRKTLDSGFGLKRSPQQVNFHKHFEYSCLPAIYGDDEWISEGPRVMQEMGIKQLKKETIVVARRRIGKTYALAMFCVALLYHCPGMDILIFSISQRTSNKFMTLCISLLKKLDLSSFIKLKDNYEEFKMANAFDESDIRVLKCRPGNVNVCLFFSLSLLCGLLYGTFL